MIEKYLSDKGQHMNINGTCTDDRQILTGVLLGSILGRFFLLLYMNDLDAFSGDSKVAMFADDTTIMNGGLFKNYSLQEDFESVSN